jgi:general secretion pathway protein D
MREFALATIRALSVLSAIAVGGCTELIQATSTWPESATPPDAVLKQPLPEAKPIEAPKPTVEAAPARPAAEIIRGSGRFVSTPKAHAEVTSEGDITLNFADADIREVAKVILGDILQQNYVVDPAVQGTITIKTSRPMPRDALVPTLEALLELNGAALVSTSAGYKVLPIPQAPRATTLRGVGNLAPARAPGYGVQIVPLQHVSAGEMVNVLTPIVPESSILYVDKVRNVLLLGGTQAELQNILDTIALFDVDWLEGMSFGFFPLQNANATEIVDEVSAILGSGENAPLADLLRFVPIERLNALIVISPKASYIDKAAGWIKRLDREHEQETPKLFVYHVQNKRAGDLAQTLSQIFAGTGERAPTETLRPGLRPVTMESAGTGGYGTGSAAAGTANQTSETRTAANGRSQTTSATQRADTTASRQQRRARASAAGTVSATLQVGEGREARIIADESNNALIVMATPADYRMIESALQKLDLVPMQVLIEATIAEVRLNDELKYGLQWFFESGNHSGLLTQGNSANIAGVFPGFNYIFAANGARVVLNALDSITDVNVISSPTLLVLDNETASLQVGDEVPIATRSAVSTIDPTAPIVNEIEQRETGVILTVTPRVNASGLVTLDIEQEISDVDDTIVTGINSPSIRQRRIQTVVAVQSGETVALGGLIRETRDRGNAGIPILHEIPIIGSLFGSTSDTRERTELLVVITPRVVRNNSDARQITDDLRKRLRSISPLDRKIQ